MSAVSFRGDPALTWKVRSTEMPGPPTIEVAPSPDPDEAGRGVVATGPVGSRRLGRWRLFRYAVRCWRGGPIPDLGDAVGGPRTLTRDAEHVRRLLDAVRGTKKSGGVVSVRSELTWAEPD